MSDKKRKCIVLYDDQKVDTFKNQTLRLPLRKKLRIEENTKFSDRDQENSINQGSGTFLFPRNAFIIFALRFPSPSLAATEIRGHITRCFFPPHTMVRALYLKVSRGGKKLSEGQPPAGDFNPGLGALGKARSE